MRVLDRYLMRELFVPILVCSITLIFLVLIADLFNNIDTLLKNHAPLLSIFRYYLALTPYAFIQTVPWATLLGTIYLLVNFNFHNEIIAMKVSGLRITTIARPLLFLGFLIGIASFFISDDLVPKSYRTAREIQEVHIEKKRRKNEGRVYSNVTYYSERNQLQYYRFFNYGKKEVEDAILLWLDPDTRRTEKKMVAKKGTWQEKGWFFENVTEYEMDPQGRILGEPRNYPSKLYTDVHTRPEDLLYAASDIEFLSRRELKHYIQKLEENGIRPYSEQVDYHYRLAAPWHSILMMLIAIPLLSPTRTKKVIALNVLICLGIVFLFHVAGAVSMALGKAGKINPFLSAWMNTIIFSTAALVLIERGNE